MPNKQKHQPQSGAEQRSTPASAHQTSESATPFTPFDPVLFAKASEMSSDAIIIADANERISYVNPSCCAVSGFTAPELIGTPFSRLVRCGSIESDEVTAAAPVVAGGEWEGLIQMARKDHAPLWARGAVHVVRDLGGIVRRIVSIAGAHHAGLEASYRTLFDRLHHGAAVFRARLGPAGATEFDIIDVNTAFERMMGVKRSEVVGGALSDAFPDSASRWLPVLQRVSETRETARVRDSRIVDGVVCAFDVVASSAEPDQIVCVLEDVSDHVRLEEQFRQAQKMEVVGQVAGGMAHDFNNVLTGIGLQVEMLLAMPDMPDCAKGLLRDVAAQSNRTASVTRQLLGFSRREGPARKEIVNVSQLVADLLNMLSHLVSSRIRLSVGRTAPDAATRGDDGTIQQVLLNLCLNARDAMPRGGSLKIDVDVLDGAGERAGKYVCITVADTGSGMTPDVQARLFEPFFTTKEKGHGTGLGLCTARRLVEQQQGWMTVESAPARGTTFRVYLPHENGGAGGPSTQRDLRNETHRS